MIDDIFVFDNVIHVYDFSDENSKLDMPETHAWRNHWQKSVRRTRWEEGPIGKFTPDYGWLRRISTDDMYEMEFVLSPVDMAMAHAVPVFDWFKNEGEGERKGWRARQFAASMEAMDGGGHDRKFTVDGFDWEGLGEATVVDVSSE